MQTPNYFQQMMDTQQNMLDFWMNNSKKAMEAFGQQKEEKAPANMYLEWFDKQREFFQSYMKENSSGSTEDMQAQFQQWMDMQTDFTKRWMKQTQEQMAEMKMPKTAKEGMEQMQHWMKDGSQQWQKQMENLLPSNMKPFFKNATEAYENMASNWESINKMIRFGVKQQEMVDQFFSMEAYKDFIDKFMGFMPMDNLSDAMDTANEYFEQMIQQVGKYNMGMQPVLDMMREGAAYGKQMNMAPMFDMLHDMSNRMYQSSSPFADTMMQGRMADAAKQLREAQAAYMGYLVKSAEMQLLVYQGGQGTLAKVVAELGEQFQKEGKVVDFQTFYDHYINHLEADITEVFESDAYSQTQAAVAKMGTTAKMHTDKAMELIFEDMPFFSRSEADDLALELAAMRKRVRGLEQRLEEAEAEVQAPAKKTTRKTKATAK